ncbi:1 concanamycin induced protein c [Favolaschia claudopus]|uniref:1 concanamycin induced protein c n=1 Tax=Favolaschia claudopus TaxID=2862362 RepID=A0AAW0DI47_9AGAR
MGWFHHESDEAKAYDEVVNAPHKAALSHELIAAAASYEAAKAYTKHCEENGKPQSHAKAKEILAGLTGAFVDRIVETKGLDAVDKEKAKHEAHKKNEAKLNEHGGFDV